MRRIENYLTLRATMIMGPEKRIKCCVVKKRQQTIRIPRFAIYELLNDKYGLQYYSIKSRLPSGQTLSNAKFHGELRHNQKIIQQHMLANIYTDARLKHGSAGCILNLEAGQGKSYLAANLISCFKKRTAIVIHSSALLEQWEKVIRSCYPNATIGYYHSKKKQLGDIMILIINSVLSKEFKFKTKLPKQKGKRAQYRTETFTPGEFFAQFGFMIYDECHLYCSKVFGKAFSIAQTPYVLGLSATPDEHALKFDKLVWWGLGPVLDAKLLSGYQQTDNQFTGEVRRIMFYGEPKYTKIIRNQITDMVSIAETITMLCQDEKRTRLIIWCVRQCRALNLNTFVFADRREYLEKIRSYLLMEKHNLDEEDPNKLIHVMTTDAEYTRLVGGSSQEEMARAEKQSTIVLTTYQFMGTGKSIPRMNALVLATPRKSKMAQYIKRIFRLGSDQSIQRVIYDLTDMKVTVKNQWSVRKKYYTSQNFTITEQKIKASQVAKL